VIQTVEIKEYPDAVVGVQGEGMLLSTYLWPLFFLLRETRIHSALENGARSQVTPNPQPKSQHKFGEPWMQKYCLQLINDESLVLNILKGINAEITKG
jgi:hypothetical protein